MAVRSIRIRLIATCVATALGITKPVHGATPAGVRDWMVVYEHAVNDYRHGHYAAAHNQLLELADFGSAPAQTILGYMYLKGEASARLPPVAAVWFLRAANRGYPPAQLALAVLYDQGLGVAPNSATALSWYLLAAQRGGPDIATTAGRAVARLRPTLSPATNDKVDAKVRLWRPSLPLIP